METTIILGLYRGYIYGPEEVLRFLLMSLGMALFDWLQGV